jgi:hypothetical protein
MTLIDSYNSILNLNLNEIVMNGIFALLIIIFGVFLGKMISIGLKRISKKMELNKRIRGSFIELFILVIKWSIYLLFLNWGLNQLEIPALTKAFTNAIIILPALTGALLILVIGFAIAIYLREIIEDIEVNGWEIISKILFYFILYVFGVYALKIALIAFDSNTTNLIILILTGVVGFGMVYVLSKKELSKSHKN